MKRKMYMGVFSLLLAFSAASQIAVKEAKADTTEGLFVKNGTVKLTSMDCYNFDDLMVAFNLNATHFEYDMIEIKFRCGEKYDGDFVKSYHYTKSDFLKLFNETDAYAYFQVFKEADMKEKSQWGFTRQDLYYTDTKSKAENSILQVTVIGHNYVMSNGEEWRSSVQLNDFSIPMKGRMKISWFAFNYGKYPEETISGDCYE